MGNNKTQVEERFELLVCLNTLDKANCIKGDTYIEIEHYILNIK